MEFISIFDTKYRRTHTEGGKKVVRCFPTCKPNGHRANGFCGASVVVKYDTSRDLSYWGTFTPEGESPLSMGKIVDKTFFNSSSDEPNLKSHEWFKGVPSTSESNEPVIKFDPGPVSWNYSWWSSHKSLSAVFHKFSIYGCIAMPGDKFQVVFHADSSKFQLYSKIAAATKSDSAVESSNSLPQIKRKRSSETTDSHPKLQRATSKFNEKLKHEALSALCTSGGVYCGLNIDALSINQRRNLTLDRLYLLFRQSEDVVTSESIRNMFIKYDYNRAEYLVPIVKQAFENFLKLICDNDKIHNSIIRWAAKDMHVAFKDQCLSEIDRQLEWDPIKEIDDTPDTVNGVKTIFGEFREIFRDIMLSAVSMTGFNITDFFELMNYASRYGDIPMDPFHPPSMEAAQLLYSQLHGSSLTNPAIYSSGKDKFFDLKSHRAYGRDLLLYNRYKYQKKVHDHLRELKFSDMVNSQLSVEYVNPKYDLNGVWVDELSLSSQQDAVVLEVEGAIGKLAGTFLSRMLRRSQVKLYIKHTMTNLVITAQPMHLFSFTYFFILDGGIHPMPPNYPMIHFAETLCLTKPQKQRYVTFPDDSQASTIVFLDLDILLDHAKVVSMYPEFSTRSAAKTYRYYQAIRIGLSERDKLFIQYSDYFVPDFFETAFSVDFARGCYFRGDECPFLIQRTSVSYLRSMLESREDELAIFDLLL